MENITVWTKQHKSVLDTIDRAGRYTARREYIALDLQEHAGLVLEAYDWLVRHSPDAKNRPDDAEFPVWVSYTGEAAMLLSAGTAILELSVDPRAVTPVNIAKWGAILNYSYLPLDPQDAARHRQLLEAYGVSDARAYMSQFYPIIKREIEESWVRLFDDSVSLGGDGQYGLIWEIRKEWVKRVIQ